MAGPYSEVEIRRLFAARKISPTAMIRQGTSNWRNASEVIAIFEELDKNGWYVQNSALKTSGPFTARRLLELIQSGTVAQEFSVKQGKNGQWQEVSAALALLSSSDANASTVEAPNVESQNQQAGLKGLAASFGQQAHFKSIEMIDLPKAYLSIGLRAMETQACRAQLEAWFSQLEQIDSQLIELRVPVPKLPNETLSDKTTRLAQQARQRIESESLQQQRRTRLIELGRKISENPAWDKEGVFAEDIEKVRKLKDQLRTLQGKITTTNSSNSEYFKRWKMRLIGACAATILACVAYWYLQPRSAEEELQQAIADTQEELKQAAEDRQEQLEELMRKATERTRAEVERLQRAIKDMRSRSETAKNSGIASKENAATVAQLERELRQLEANEQQRLADETRKLEIETQKRATQEALDKAQQDRSAYCKEVFGRIRLDPDKTIRLSEFLTSTGTTVELRGPGLDKFRKAIEQERWLDLINLLLEREFSELPNSDQIKSAARALQSREFQILLKTNSPLIRDTFAKPEFNRTLVTLSMPEDESGANFDVDMNDRWSMHPDGIGFMQAWTASHGATCVTLVDRSELNEKHKEFTLAWVQRLEYLTEKARLGEIEEDILPELKRAAGQTARENVEVWALTRAIAGETTNDTTKAAATKLFSLPKRGRYMGESFSTAKKQSQPAMLIFCEDIAAWSNHLGEAHALYIRDRNHPLEKQGMYVYLGKTSGVFVVRAFSNQAFHASVYWGGNRDSATLDELISSSGASSDLTGIWQSDDCRIINFVGNDAEMKKQWKSILATYAPTCLQIPRK